MSVVKGLLAASFAFGFISVVGCSSDNDDTPADTTDPVISNLSHADNEKVIGNRTITFTADVTDNSTLTVTMTHNGNPVTVTPSGDTYSASITLEDRTNNTVVVSANDGSNTASQTLTLNYPFLAFTNGQAASVVIGQLDFDGGLPNRGNATPAANTIDKPYDVKVISNRLYIADRNNNRVLGFDSIPASNNANADFVIGQDSFTTNVSGIANNQLNNPRSFDSGDNQFFVGHSNGGRINHWSSIPISNALADLTIGQDGFIEGSFFSCEQNKFNFIVDSIQYVSGKLIASDSAGHRVLIWNSIPSTSGVAPDIVLGQQDFTHCAANDANNDGVSEGVPTASTLSAPRGVWSDGTKLLVSDNNNDRLLIWNEFPTSNFQAADIVLGQANFTSYVARSGITAKNMIPEGVYSNDNQLFVADGDGSRVMIWDSWPITNNQAADRVLGSETLTAGQQALGNNANLDTPKALTVFEDKLILSDIADHRILIFQAP